jgi:hypothetical protein
MWAARSAPIPRPTPFLRIQRLRSKQKGRLVTEAALVCVENGYGQPF